MTISSPSSLHLFPLLTHYTPPHPPKQQHLCFSVFSGFPTLNATQTSPSALLRPLWKPAQWHSQQPCVQHRTSAARSKWCHCPPEQTVSRGQRRREKEKRREGWEEGAVGGRDKKANLWGRAGRLTAKCNNISLQSWPAEKTFWTQLCIYFFSALTSPMETHSCHASLPFPV